MSQNLTISQSPARAFIERIRTDRGFAMMLDEVQSRDELLRVAKSAGYSFTQAELKNALVALMELSESDLARVSGGVAAITLCRELFMIRNYCES